MSLFKNTYHTGYLNIKKNNKPSINQYGQIYMKSNNKLYFLNKNGDEYLLSYNLTIQTIDKLYANNTALTINELNTPIIWNSITTLPNITVSNADITIGTPGIYSIMYTVIVNNTLPAIGLSPTISTILDINNVNKIMSNEIILMDSSNYNYIQTYNGIFNIPAFSIVKLIVNQNTGSSGASVTPEINIQKIDVQNYLTCDGTLSISNNIITPIIWNNNTQTGNIYMTGNNASIKIYDAGYYMIHYKIVYTGTTVVLNPYISSYINNDVCKNNELIMVDNGNINYTVNTSTILKLNTLDDIILNVLHNMGGDIDAVTNLNVYKMNTSNYLKISNENFMLPNNVITSVSWTNTIDQININYTGNAITILEAGTYELSYQVNLSGGCTSLSPTITSYLLNMRTSNALAQQKKLVLASSNSINYTYNKTDRMDLEIGDVIHLVMMQTTGVILTVNTTLTILNII
jgi:hypothetical protein